MQCQRAGHDVLLVDGVGDELLGELSDSRQLLQDGVILTVRGFPAAAPQTGIDFERKRISIVGN